MAAITSSRPAKARHRPVMNVTPLVDVVLVLLIIFMVVIPALDQAVDVRIPGIFNVDEKTEEKGRPFMLSVTKEGDIYLEEEKIAPPRLEARMRQVSRREPSRRLIVRADGQVPYGKVRRIYHSLQGVGFPGVSLRVNHRQEDRATP